MRLAFSSACDVDAVCCELCRKPALLLRRSAIGQCIADAATQFPTVLPLFPPPRVLNQHPAEIVARRAQGLALRAPGRFRRRAEAASAGCHARATQLPHTLDAAGVAAPRQRRARRAQLCM